MQANTTALPETDSEMTRSIQEELISQASAGIVELPMLDIIFARMAVSLVSAFKSKAAFLCDIHFDKVEYRSWEDVAGELDPFGICANVEAKPWDGSFAISLDSGMIFSALELQMGGTPRPDSAPKRPVSVIERHIARQLVEVVLTDFSANVSRLTEARFLLDTMETPQQMAAMQGGKTPCAVGKMSVEIGPCKGSFSIIIPMATLEPVQDKFSKVFLGDKLGGDKSWREHILSTINGSSVKVTARVHQLSIPLVDILEWKPGTVIDLGVSEDKEISIICSGIPVFQGYAGKHKGGRVGFRVVREIEGGDLNPTEADTLGIQQPDAEGREE
ncbi:flagellar motor switch protein FliM [Neptunicoccus cionae]|uniref:flagellar motor switch protein FliM n=1 Tax=Neptunicoccus cionae TaxID=2035344 RepID=UPI000C77CC4E|nr:FliM/FliN family flagellar motor switch protein [Amylibacter cionae]PLS21157.1 hypothetical protein C0U40_13500 [Amylibacter cionae]